MAPERDGEATTDALDRLEGLVARLERGLDALASGTASGPSIIKADAAMFYTLSASDIAAELGLPSTRVSMLLNSACLDLVHRRPELWSHEIFEKTKRRLWHPLTVAYLREVITNPSHPDRSLGAPYCLRAIEECRAALERTLNAG
jgi:hypothetical protein